jgi:hypothetical protein
MGQYELLDTLPLHVDERADQGKGLTCFLMISYSLVSWERAYEAIPNTLNQSDTGTQPLG